MSRPVLVSSSSADHVLFGLTRLDHLFQPQATTTPGYLPITACPLCTPSPACLVLVLLANLISDPSVTKLKGVAMEFGRRSIKR
jgi:hypothetical protein